MSEKPLKIFVIAGEASGDLLGARLMSALSQLTSGNISFDGVGGEQMRAAGLKPLFPMEELSVMGLTEVLPKLPFLLRRIRETAACITNSKPDAVVTIDSPDFSFRVIKKLRKAGFQSPCIHYVAPSVWAWRPGRAKKLARLVDHVLALLPFEPPYFEREGLGCTFVGHPVVETAARHNPASNDRKTLVLLPGSRVGEVSRLLPAFKECVDLIQRKIPDVRVVVPTLPHLVPLIKASGFEPLLGETEKKNCFITADVALAASGTVALELAAAGLPSVIGYRLNPLTAFLAKRLVKIPYVSLVNIILGRSVVPEFLLENCRAELLAPAVLALLDNPAAAQRQREAYREALARLDPGMSPGMKAAQVVLDVITAAARST